MNTLPYDEIHIEDLEVFANHGVFPEETKLGQKFLISLTMYVDSRSAGKTDCLESSVDYGDVSCFITEYTKAHPRKLIESAAGELAEAIMLRYTILKGVTIGDNVVIGSNCLITTDIPSNSVVKLSQEQAMEVRRECHSR